MKLSEWKYVYETDRFFFKDDGGRQLGPHDMASYVSSLEQANTELKAKAHAADALYKATKAYRARGYHDVNKAWEQELDSALAEYAAG